MDDEFIIRKIKSSKNNKYTHDYYDSKGVMVKDKDIIGKYTKGIYVPPAYNNVKLFLDKSLKVLAIGTDIKGRKQYIYHKDFIQKQQNKKFDHMISFGKDFNKINKKINNDFNSMKDSKEKQIAIILKLIMDCHFRVGNERSKNNRAYGTTTLEKKHLKVKKDSIVVDFIGKKSVRNTCTVKNKRMIKTLKKKRKTLTKNDRIFSYRKGDKYYNIKSSDVNKYLKKFGKYSTKNFRTWGANIEFILEILKNNDKNKKNIVKECITNVSKRLHNTYSVCKSNYIDPELVNLYEEDPERFIDLFGKGKYSKEMIYQKYVEFLQNIK
tara:strand:+ start:87 stop:1058 length:972 start_codon:yes stop_codon:yes gene_type:complete